MKITILGSWAPYPRAGGACSSYLVEQGGLNFLVDCGNGALSKMQEYIDFRTLEAVIISHLHPDHYLDIYPLRHAIDGALKDGSRKEKLKVFLPSQPKEEFLKVYSYKSVFDIIPIETVPMEEALAKDEVVRLYNYNNTSLRFFVTKHPLLTYAISIEDKINLKRMVYSSDTAYKEELVEFFKEADLLICEASLQESHKELTKVGHLTSREAGTLAKKAQVKKLIVTHLWPEYDLNITLKEAEEGFNAKVDLAVEGNNYSI